MAYKQGYDDRMDESMSMRDGKESSKKQSYKDRRDESRGMSGGVFNLKDNTQAGEVKQVPTDSEQYDMGRVRYESVGSKGYPAQAWDYKY